MQMANIRLLVDKFDDCFEFYSKTMGFEIEWGKKGDVYGSFKVSDAMTLSIFKASLMNEHLGVTNPRNNEGNQMVLTFSSENVDVVFKLLKGKGVIFMNEPHDMHGWGIRCVHLTDPEGNLIEIHTELPMDQWSQDLRDDVENYQ